MSAALPLPTTRAWSELSARGATITVAPSTLVTVQAPADVASELRAAIAWRIDVMRTQLREGARLGGTPPTPVAVPGLVLPLAPACRWRGYADVYGRRVWQERTAQRVMPGFCASCGEAAGHETGDCALCTAARIAALRAEGRLGAPSTWTPPPPRDVDAWRAELLAPIARPDPLPSPAPRPVWACEVCGQEQRGHRDEGCGRCELRAADTISTAKLGGGDDEGSDDE